MNSSSLSQLAPTSLLERSLKRACIEQCMKESTKPAQTLLRIRISKSSSGGQYLTRFPFLWTNLVFRPLQKKTSKTKTSPKGKTAAKKSTDEAELTNAMKSLAVSPKKPPTSSTSSPKRPVVKSPVDDFPLLASEEAELHFWDTKHGYFSKQADGTAKIVKRPNAGYEYWLIASTEEGQLLTHKINTEMNQRWSSKMYSLTWNNFSEKTQTSWCFRFLDEQAFVTFQTAFTKALWETLHQTSWEKSKV
jgi:hypothetical protein